MSSKKDCHMKVVVRVRPENEKEQRENSRTVVQVVDENVLIFDPKEEQEGFYYQGKMQKLRDLNRRVNKDARFMFDRIFDWDSRNEEIHGETTKLLLDSLLEGYNCSVFAYGATGAGKTYTMLGSNSSRGINYLMMTDLYERINSLSHEKNFSVRVSYLEVYNEMVRDLIQTTGPLNIREDAQQRIIVPGLTSHEPDDVDHLLNMLEKGNRNRTQHPTDANAESSRSHAVFTVYITQHDKASGLSENVKVSKLCLVDLAGSEKATVVKTGRATQREGANINKSLLALGNCINALADKNRKAHVPYRNSKLTHLLKDSLGGNCRTVMIAAISPSSLTFEDTYNTLKYGDRAKNIQFSLKMNEMKVDAHVTKYVKIVDELKREVASLRNQLKEAQSKQTLPPPPPQETITKVITVTAKTPQVESFQGTIREIFEEKMNLRRDLLAQQSSEHDLQWRITKRKESSDKLSQFSIGSVYDIGSNWASKTDRAITSMKTQLDANKCRQQVLSQQLSRNENRLKTLKEEMANLPGGMPELLSLHLKSAEQEVEIRDLRQQTKHLVQHAHVKNAEIGKLERLQDMLLPTVKNYYMIMKGHDIVTTSIQTGYEEIEKHLKTDGNKETCRVRWIDQDSPACSRSDINQFLFLDIAHSVPHSPCSVFEKKSRKLESEEDVDSSPVKRCRRPLGLTTPPRKVPLSLFTSPGPLKDEEMPDSNYLLTPAQPRAFDFTPLKIDAEGLEKVRENLNGTFSKEDEDCAQDSLDSTFTMPVVPVIVGQPDLNETFKKSDEDNVALTSVNRPSLRPSNRPNQPTRTLKSSMSVPSLGSVKSIKKLPVFDAKLKLERMKDMRRQIMTKENTNNNLKMTNKKKWSSNNAHPYLGCQKSKFNKPSSTGDPRSRTASRLPDSCKS